MSSLIPIKTASLANSASLNATDQQRIKRLWQGYLWPQKGKLFAALFFMALYAAATAGFVYVITLVIDAAGTLDGNSAEALSTAKRYAWIVLPFLIGVPLLSGLTGYIQRILTNSIALHTVGSMQKEMFSSAHHLDYAQFTREPIGNLISKFTNDVTVISNALVRILGNLFKDILTVVFTISMMLWTNWQLSLAMVIFGLAFWPIIAISKKLRGNAHDVQNHIGRITSELKESFSGARMVKAYGLEEIEISRLNLSFDKRIRLYLKLVTQQARVDPILEVLGGAVIACVVIFGVFLFAKGQATGGQIAGVLGGLMILAPRLRALGTLNNVIQEGLTALTRIFDVIDEQPQITQSANAAPLATSNGHVSFENVYFNYEDGTPALNGVTFEAKMGETIALVGESGGGKSTIINLIPRLYDATDGTVKIDGIDIRELTLDSLRNSMALVSQDVTLFETTISDNIGFGDQSASKDDIIASAKAANAHDFIMQLPNGYGTVLGEDGDTLSGGQKQRLAIARAILRDAPILLLDEATSALDAESEAKVQSALEQLSTGRTTLVVAHKLSTVQNADKIYVLEDGKVIESGTHKSLSKKRKGVYAKLHKLQG